MQDRICLQEFQQKVTELHREAVQKGIKESTIEDVFLGRQCTDKKPPADDKSKVKEKRPRWCSPSVYVTFGIVVALVSSVAAIFIQAFDIRSYSDFYNVINDTPCILDNDAALMEVARPLAKCSFCAGMTEVAIEKNLSTRNFLEKYAHTSVPVLIKDATFNWTAMSNFSFHFFQDLYSQSRGSFAYHDEECQFFPYKTDFENLKQALSISDARANFNEGEKPWYIGWSNCDERIEKKLRRHYSRPYFIPERSEGSPIDWIFMGGPGLGAFIHLDYVQKPSWQAQISGMKTWTLLPVPECESLCHSMNVTVHKGDIIVIDTNQWYHATFIHPGEISITIGSEYKLN